MLDDFTLASGDHGNVAKEGGELRLSAARQTDWFHKPDGSGRSTNVVRMQREVDAPLFALSAKISVDFVATYDAGALFIEVDEDHWAKLAFERSTGGEASIVSVVTRGTSDDADGPVSGADAIWLRLYCDGRIVAFHHSADGRQWRFHRLFTLPNLATRPVRIGFAAQSPTAEGATATFTDIALTFDPISNMRDGS